MNEEELLKRIERLEDIAADIGKLDKSLKYFVSTLWVLVLFSVGADFMEWMR